MDEVDVTQHYPTYNSDVDPARGIGSLMGIVQDGAMALKKYTIEELNKKV